MKKLTLRIAKFDRLIVVEQLERTGEWKNSTHVYVQGDLHLYKSEARIDLQEGIYDKNVSIREFADNTERDEYAQKLVKWITEEQFDVIGKLEVGKMCEVSDDWEEWTQRIYAGKSAKQLGEEKRFLAVNALNDNMLRRWRYAKPLNDSLNVDGEIYTWKTEE